jgi:hypothetical protein
MATGKKQAAAKKTTANKVKKAATKQPGLGKKAVNMGPLRGDNSFPPGNKPAVHDRSRTAKGIATKEAKKKVA